MRERLLHFPTSVVVVLRSVRKARHEECGLLIRSSGLESSCLYCLMIAKHIQCIASECATQTIAGDVCFSVLAGAENASRELGLWPREYPHVSPNHEVPFIRLLEQLRGQACFVKAHSERGQIMLRPLRSSPGGLFAMLSRGGAGGWRFPSAVWPIRMGSRALAAGTLSGACFCGPCVRGRHAMGPVRESSAPRALAGPLCFRV